MATIDAQARVLPVGDGVTLHIPIDDVTAPEIAIVIPALNEELTIVEFLDWCKTGLKHAGVAGEILIIDSSTDRTGQLALSHGARVLETPKRGLGRAYIDALSVIRGEYVLMGDADCTYDFRELKPFLEKFRAGYEFIMGSRFRGYIEPGAMPPLHRYLGTPVTTWILNVLFSGHFSDIHCGMRGITKNALLNMQLQSQSWEYASEMVLKSVHMKLRTTEVPVRFLKDRHGRVSHHKRAGWFSPWQAAWINLRAMFIHGVDFFVYKPGLLLLALGLSLTLPATLGPVTLGPITLSLYWMMFGLTLAVLGLQGFYAGCLAQLLYDLTGTARRRWLRVFRYDRTVMTSALCVTAGAALVLPLVRTYLAHDFSLPEKLDKVNYMAITGLLLLISGFSTFVFTLLLHGIALHTKR